MCGIVGDRFDECGRGNLTSNVDGNENEGEDWPEICGCTISVRQNEDIISVWNRVEGDPKVREKIKYVGPIVVRFRCVFTVRSGTRFV